MPTFPNTRVPARILVPLIVACALFMENLDSTVLSTALPAIARELNEDPIDLKLALTILNTSCWRGLPGRDVASGVGVAAALREIVAADPELCGVRILADLGGVHVPQPEFEQLGGAPYRVREQLGAIWRESARGRIAPDEAEIPAAALHQRDLAGVEGGGVHVHAAAAGTGDRTMPMKPGSASTRVSQRRSAG